MRKLAFMLTIPFFLAIAGCAAGRAIFPFGSVTAADAEWSGVAGPTVSILGTVDPTAARAQEILRLLGLDATSRLGLYLPLTVVGESAPRLVVCLGTWEDRCSAIKEGSLVNFAGYSIGGDKWAPKRLGT